MNRPSSILLPACLLLLNFASVAQDSAVYRNNISAVFFTQQEFFFHANEGDKEEYVTSEKNYKINSKILYFKFLMKEKGHIEQGV